MILNLLSGAVLLLGFSNLLNHFRSTLFDDWIDVATVMALLIFVLGLTAANLAVGGALVLRWLE